ncbi:MAG: transporter [Thermodesulfobacteriota bacterium]
MKKLCLLLMFCFTILSPISAWAYIGLCCGKCGGNMPMNIPGGGVPETHEFRFKLSPMYMRMDGLREGTGEVDPDAILPAMGMPGPNEFMAAQTDMDMYMASVAAGYSFTDRFFGGVMFMWLKKDMDMKFSNMMRTTAGTDGFTMKSAGMGDTMLMGKYRLYADDPLIPTSQASLFIGLSLPTGSISEKNASHPLPARKGEQLPYGMQLGSGTFDPTLGLLYQGSSSPLWWGVNLMYTGRWYENPRDYRLGDEYRYDLYGMYQFRHDALVQLQINGKYQGGVKGEMDEFRTGASGRVVQGDAASGFMTPLWDPANYGGHKIAATIGLQWQPLPLHILDVNFGVPFHQRLNGPQLEEDYRVMLTWYLEWPTRASKRYSGGKNGGGSRLGF